MADLGVVLDKLSGFESADDLAAFLIGYGIVATPQDARQCAISQFIRTETGEAGIITTTFGISIEKNDINSLPYQEQVFKHTNAMKEFVRGFDRNAYPELVEDGYDFDEGTCSCWHCRPKTVIALIQSK